MKEVVEIPIGKIKVGEHEQRLEKEDQDINSLAESIRRIGVLSPLMVRSDKDGFHLVAGHRRIMAAKLAGLTNIPCIMSNCSRNVENEICFAENFYRKNLSPVELACALADVLGKGEMTVSELADGFHKSEHWVRSMIAIGDWPVDVQEAIHNERLSVSAGSNLAVVTDDTYRAFLVKNAIEAGATARTTASWLQAWRAMQPASEAITSGPVAAGAPAQPIIPQAPCLACGEIFPVDRMSHVPLCGDCIKLIRQVPMSLVQQ